MLLELLLILLALALLGLSGFVLYMALRKKHDQPAAFPFLFGGWIDWVGDNKTGGNARKVIDQMITGPANYLVINVDWRKPAELEGYIRTEELELLDRFRAKGGYFVVGFGGTADDTDAGLFSQDLTPLKDFVSRVRARHDFDGLNLDYEPSNMWQRFDKFAQWIRAIDEDTTCYIGAKNLFILDTCEAGCLGSSTDRIKFFQGMANLMKQLKRIRLMYEQEAYETSMASITNIKSSLQSGFGPMVSHVILLYARYSDRDTLKSSGLTFAQAASKDKSDGFGGSALWYVTHTDVPDVTF